MPADDELPYVKPHEWVDVVDRLRLDVGVGKKRVAAKTIKGIAFRLAWWADWDFGTGVYPGLARTAVVCEVDYDTVKRVFAVLRDLRLLTLVTAKRGPRGRRSEVADEYRLTIPPDLLDRVRVLSPTELAKEVAAVREGKRGKRVAGVTHPPNSPVDNYLPLELQGECTPATERPVEKVAGVRPRADSELRGDCPPSCGGDAPLPTTKEQALTTNTQDPVPAQPPDTRAHAHENPEPPPAEGKCTAHGLAAGARPDGTAVCPLCRREGIAPVIQLHTKRSAS